MKHLDLFLHEEAARCLLCENAPCSKACGKGDPARAIRAIRFNNEKNAWRWLDDCSDEDLQKAEKACIHYDHPIRITELKQAIPHPSTLHSKLCKQDIREVSPRFDAVREGSSFAGFRNMEQLSENPYEVDFDILRRLKQNYPTKIVVASIMGEYEEEWIELAKMAEEAGCDAVELNFSCPQMRLSGMGSDVGQDPELVTFYTAYVKRNVKIPVIPKMTPNITQINQPAMGAYFAGADAISAINTIKSVTMTPTAKVDEKWTISGLSGRSVKPIALRYILEMAKNPIMKNIQLSGIGGIETWHDALEFIQLGCRNVQVCTAVMQYGYRIIDDLVMGLQTYLQERGIEKLEDLVGEQLPAFVRPSDLDRDTKVFPTVNREKCIGCGRCYVSCQDGGHQAIRFDPDTRQPHIIGAKCVGCHLCRLVCPVGAMGLARRIKK